MKKTPFLIILLAALNLSLQAELLLVLEPEVEIAFGGQSYEVNSPPGFTAEGIKAFILSGQYVPGLRMGFYDYGPRSSPIGACLTAAFAFAQLGARDYDNNLGVSYNLNRLKLAAMACIPFVKEDSDIMTANIGGYYAIPLGGSYSTANSSYPRSLDFSDISGDYGLRAELSFLAAFAYYEGGKPAMGGISATLYAEVNLNDIAPKSEEELRYWDIGFGFGVPFYFWLIA